GLPDASRDVVERLIPGHALPLPFPAGARPPERVEDALGIGDLIQRGGTLGAVPAAAARMRGIALELLDLQRLLVHVGEEPAGRLAVEADGGDERVLALHLARPGA